MKSFRIDRDSVDTFLASWPIFIAAIALAACIVWFGWVHWWWRVTAVTVAGLYIVYVMRGHLAALIHKKYPHAKAPLLLSIGFVAMTLGLLVRMTFPKLQGGWLDLTWIAVAFCSILAFVVINRGDPDVK